jgi:hypothetical protein
MIVINREVEEGCDLYCSDGILIGRINTVIEFSGVRVQIREQKLEGYYIVFKGERIMINGQGKLNWPRDLFNRHMDDLTKLF